MTLDKEISLKELLSQIWQAKSLIIMGASLCFIMGLIAIQLITPQYKASMIVAPADGYGLGDYSSKIQYDHIASLPFWRPKDQEGASTDFYRFIYTLRGYAAAEILMKDNNVLNSINAVVKNKVTTPEELSVYLTKNLQVDPLGATPLRKLTYQHPDPEFAAALLRKIHLVADQMIRRDRRQQSQSRIDYLQKSLNKTLNPDHRKIITNLLMQQEHIQMLANLDEAYAAIVVEPASHSPKPTWPNKPLIMFLSLIIGGMFGFIAWVLSRQKYD